MDAGSQDGDRCLPVCVRKLTSACDCLESPSTPLSCLLLHSKHHLSLEAQPQPQPSNKLSTLCFGVTYVVAMTLTLPLPSYVSPS